MSTLDDLPPYRKAKLLWEFDHFGEHGIDAMVRERAGKPCGLSGVLSPSSPRMAVLGGDGRFHLMSDGRMICSEKFTDQGWEHQDHCSWTETDGRLVYGFRAGGTFGSTTYTWFVQATTAEGVPPSSVPPEQQCQGSRHRTLQHWPPPPAKTPAVRRLRAALIDSLGPDSTCAVPFQGRWWITTTPRAWCVASCASCATGPWRNARTSTAARRPTT